uniref:Uncharacterized protein n=1 Tax=Parastrongyloides trichosuri TaxID=131310 RepID=A0A0N4ZJJ5_PARTI
IPIGREYGVFIHYLYAFSGISPFVGVKKRFKSYYEKARILGNPGYLKHYATNDGFDDERQFNEVRDGTQQHENKEAYEPTQNSDNEVNESQQNNGENEICNEPSIIPTRSMDESQQNSDEDEILNELSTIPTRSLDESLSLFINQIVNNDTSRTNIDNLDVSQNNINISVPSDSNLTSHIAVTPTSITKNIVTTNAPKRKDFKKLKQVIPSKYFIMENVNANISNSDIKNVISPKSAIIENLDPNIPSGSGIEYSKPIIPTEKKNAYNLEKNKQNKRNVECELEANVTRRKKRIDINPKKYPLIILFFIFNSSILY